MTSHRVPVNWRAVFVAVLLLALAAAPFVWFEFFAEPTTSLRYMRRGDARYRRGEYELALQDYSAALVLEPRAAYLFGRRANARFMLGKYREAIGDYTTALKFGEKHAVLYTYRGECLSKEAQYQSALRDFRSALKLDPNEAHSHNSIAWLFATCPEAEVRDGPKAVSHACRAKELMPSTPWYVLDTLAAAYAEVGDFDEAKRLQTETIGAAPPEEREECRVALRLYENKQPRRDSKNERFADD